jgi:hypothetical protein
MKCHLFAIVLSATTMLASALEPGRYLISAYRTGTGLPAKITPNEVHRGYLLTVPKEGPPQLEIATSSMAADCKIEKIESVRITNGRDDGNFTLEAKFIESYPGESLTYLLNLSFDMRTRTAAGSEIEITGSDTTLLLARIGRLPDAANQDDAPMPAEKAAAKDQPSKDAPR